MIGIGTSTATNSRPSIDTTWQHRRKSDLQPLIDGGDSQRLNALKMTCTDPWQESCSCASAVAKIPVLTTQIHTLTQQLDEAGQERMRLLKRIDSMEWRLKHLEEEKRQEKARMQRVLADSVSQVENQNEFASHLELELENLKSTVRKEDSRVSHLRQRLSDSLREVGQAPGEDMALEDLLSIANSALRLAPGHGSQDNKPVRAHHDSLGHEVFSMPDTLQLTETIRKLRKRRSPTMMPMRRGEVPG